MAAAEGERTQKGGVVVTGGGGGIGRAVAVRVAQAGYGVVVNDLGVTVSGENPQPAAADAVVGQIIAAGGRAVAHYGSVTEMDTARSLVETAVSEYGYLEGIVVCHGILRERMIFNMTEDEWDSVVNVHLKGTFCCFRYATAQMRLQKGGSLVALTSAAGLEGSPAQANYAAAKAGLVGLTFSTALAMGKYGVNANCIVPSANTRMTSRLTEAMAATRPEGEREGPELIAELALALIDPASRHISGQLFTAVGRKLARWSPPEETASVEVGDPITFSAVRDAIDGGLGRTSLRRFAALDLPEPAPLSQAR